MMRRSAIAAGVSLLFLLLAACGSDVPRATRDGPIVAFGDSLVYGTGSSGGGFVRLLEPRIGRPIENLGRPGDTSAHALARLDTVLALRPAVVIVLLGGNDFLGQLPHDTVYANLDTILGRLRADGAAVLLAGVRSGLLDDPFAARFEELADRHGTAFVRDVLDGLWGDPALMADQIHPNDAGYQRIADRIAPVLEQMLP